MTPLAAEDFTEVQLMATKIISKASVYIKITLFKYNLSKENTKIRLTFGLAALTRANSATRKILSAGALPGK